MNRSEMKVRMQELLAENVDWEAEELSDHFTWNVMLDTPFSESAMQKRYDMSKDEILELAVEVYAQ